MAAPRSAPTFRGRYRSEENTMPTTLEQPRANGQPTHSPPPPPPRRTQRKDDNSGYWAAFSILLGMLVVVLGFVAVWMGFSARDARNDAQKAASSAGTATSMPGMDMSGGVTGSSELTSYAGQAPANAEALAKQH